MSRLLQTRIVREIPVSVDGVPLTISLEPNGLIGFRKKGFRKFAYISVEDCFQMAHTSNGQLSYPHRRNIRTASPLMEVTHKRRNGRAAKCLLDYVRQHKAPVNVTALRHWWSQHQPDRSGFKEALQYLAERRMIKQVKPLCYMFVSR